MKSVEVKNLKDNLGAYLKMVKKGEIVLIKEKNEVIAEVKKPAIAAKDRFEQFLQEEARLGNLTLAKRKKTILKIKQGKPKTKQSDWMKIYEETRSERF